MLTLGDEKLHVSWVRMSTLSKQHPLSLHRCQWVKPVTSQSRYTTSATLDACGRQPRLAILTTTCRDRSCLTPGWTEDP